jgi:hypothetical protein
MGEHKTEVIVKRCHSCLKTENLVPCGGNVDGACRNRNLLCPEHSRVKTILGKIQCHECYKAYLGNSAHSEGSRAVRTALGVTE